MRISEYSKKRLRSFFSFLHLQSIICNPHFSKYLSLSQQRILLIAAILILAVLYFRFDYHPFLPPSEEIVKEFVVEVSGDIPNPGIYIFHNPPTLKEAVQKVEGLKVDALFGDTLSSDVLETGTLITIVKESYIKIELGRMQANKLLVFSIPLDINRVSMEDLCLIPGIGESLAQEIVTYRERRNGFRSVEELKKVKGIGESKWKVFKAFFMVRPLSQ